MEDLTVYDISRKEINIIDDTATIKEAINCIGSNGERVVIVKGGKNSYFILTAGDFFNFKMNKIDLSVTLSELPLKPIEKIHKDTKVISMIDEINDIGDYTLVVDEKKEPQRILSSTNILSCMDPQLLMKKQSIGDFIGKRLLKTSYKDESTIEVISQIKNEPDGAVVIIENDIPIGIFTTKDIISLLRADEDLERPIKDYMTTPIEYITQDISIVDALNYIKNKNYKRIVVVDNEKRLLGKITQQDLIKLFHNKWIEILRHRGEELSKTNKILDERNKKLSKNINQDYLTKVFTRHKFDEYISIEIEKINRYKNEIFSLLILDIDDFKKVNDTYGHLAGDKVLKDFSKVIKAYARLSDIVARWGGEEFAVLLPSTPLEDAVIVAQKFCSAIEQHKFKHVGRITCSIGIATFKAGDTKKTLFKRADEALYISKKTGKNRVSIEPVN